MSNPVVQAGLGALSSFAGDQAGTESSQSSQSTSTSNSYQKPSTYAPTAQGYLDQIPVYQAANQAAISALNSGNAASQANLTPMIQGSYAAFDNLMDSLGIARPQEGSYAEAQRQAAYNKVGTDYQQSLDSYNSAKSTALAAGQKAATVDLNTAGIYGNFNQGDFGPNASALGDYGRVEAAYKSNDLATLADEAQHNIDQSRLPGNAAQSIPGWYDAQQAAVDSYKNFQSLSAPVNPQQAQFQAGALTDASQTSATIQAQLEADPNYQFQLAQGNKSIQAMAAARGVNNDPRVAEALQTFGQGQAAGAMQSYRDRLSGIINQGLSALNLSTGSNTSTANGVANSQYNTGQSVAGSTANATNTWQVGPVTAGSQSQSQSTSQGSSSGGGSSTLGTIGNIAGGVGSFLGGIL